MPKGEDVALSKRILRHQDHSGAFHRRCREADLGCDVPTHPRPSTTLCVRLPEDWDSRSGWSGLKVTSNHVFSWSHRQKRSGILHQTASKKERHRATAKRPPASQNQQRCKRHEHTLHQKREEASMSACGTSRKMVQANS